MNYTLDDSGNPIPEPNVLAWARWFEKANRHLGDDTIGEVRVSTVFLGFGFYSEFESEQGKKLFLWETMTFGPEPWDNLCEKYSSREEALAGHAKWVAAVRDGRLPEGC